MRALPIKVPIRKKSGNLSSYIYIYIYRLSVVLKSDLNDKIKHNFFLAVVVSFLQYGCTTWTLTKHIEKKLDSDSKRMLRVIWNKS